MSKNKTTTPSFTYTLPLQTEKFEEDMLNKKLEVARMFYNKLLFKVLKIRETVILNKNYQEAILIYKKKNKSESDIKYYKKLFNLAMKEENFNEYFIHSIATKLKNDFFFNQHLGGDFPQTIGSKIFKAVKEYHFGKKGKPRYKSKNQLKSLSGKSLKSEIKFLNGKMILSKSKTLNGKRVSNSFSLIFDKKDKDNLEAYSLSSKLKYSRLLKKFQSGKERYYLQLILEGKPFIKEKHLKNRKWSLTNKKNKPKTSGLDIGPSTIAIVAGNNNSHLLKFNSKLKDYSKERKKLQKHISNSLRINNPECFEVDTWIKKDKKWKKKLGKNIKGKKLLNKSKKLKSNKKKLTINFAKSTSLKEQSHGELLNFLLSLTNNFKSEKVSIKEWQKLWGKSILNSSPSEFMTKLSRKAENAGGKLELFSTYTTRLSQTCICKRIKKKKLSERRHICECGVNIQRDIFSAYLAKYVENNGNLDYLDIRNAKKYFRGAESHLKNVISAIAR
jgi:hypothetical protein